MVGRNELLLTLAKIHYLNLEWHIAKRIAFGTKGSISAFIIRIAILAITISIAVMIVAINLIAGFKKEISDKVFGFWGHIHISPLDANRSYENSASLTLSSGLIDSIKALPDVVAVQAYAEKAGILKKDETIEGIVLYGVGPDYKWDFFNKYLERGRPIALADSGKSGDILLSSYTAQRMALDTGQSVYAYMVKDGKPRPRKFTVSGIYKTGMQEFDEKYALIDINHIRYSNEWDPDQVGGYALNLKDEKKMDTLSAELYYGYLPTDINSSTMRESFPTIFEWINLQNLNQCIIIILLLLIAAINMITALLILILDRTSMIGILKTLGAANWSIRKIFLWNAAYIIISGILLGNAIGLVLSCIEWKFHLLSLPEDSYYLSYAPVYFNWPAIVLLNIGAFVFCLFSLLLPSWLVTRIEPVKAIRFE